MPPTPALAALIAQANQLTAAARPSFPTPAPAPGQSLADWETEVEGLRQHFDSLIPGDDDTSFSGTMREIGQGAWTARLYLPAGEPPPDGWPAVVMFHGGGFWMAGGETMRRVSHPLCRLFAEQVGATVLTVDYRLAPEHKYPDPLDDCYDSYRWVADHASELGIDSARLALFGVSSGGNMATGTALRIANSGTDLPRPRVMVLMAPCVDISGPQAMAQVEVHDGLGPEAASALAALYLPEGVDPSEPLVSPGLAPDLGGFPSTFVVAGEFDILRDQGVRLAQRLQGAGIPSASRVYPMTHTVAEPATVEAFTGDVLGVLSRALGTTEIPPRAWFPLSEV